MGGSSAGGSNTGKVSACYAIGSVVKEFLVVFGGLIGTNNGLVTVCYTSEAEVGDPAQRYNFLNRLGGLIGLNHGNVKACYVYKATAHRINNASRLGALIGDDGGVTNVVAACYAGGRNYTEMGLLGGGGGIQNSYRQSPAQGAGLRAPTQYEGSMYASWNIDVDNGLSIGVQDATMAGGATSDDPWDLGYSYEYPRLKVDFDGDGTAYLGRIW